MKKIVIFLLMLICWNQLLAQPSPKMTKEEKMQAIDMISALFEKPVPSKTPVPEVISDKGLPKDIPQADFDKKIALFTNSLYFKQSHFNENEVDVEADYFHLPNFDLIKGSYKWTKGVAKDGTNIEVSSKNAGSPSSTLDFLQEAVVYKPKAGKTLASIDGTFSMNYSTGFSQITFAKTDIGKEKIIEGMTVKLLMMDNDIAMFQIINRQDGLSYYALNAKGEPLSLEISKSEIPKTFYDAIGSDGKISASKKKEIVEKFDFVPEKEPIIGYIKARGSIAQLMVAKAKSFVAKDIPVKALKAPDFEKGEQVGSHERFENMPTAPHFDKITDTDLAKSTLKIARSNEMFGFNNHVIIVSVPISQNSAYAKVDFKDVVATKGGKKVEFEPQGAFYDEKASTFRYRLEPTSGEIPIECDEIKGTVVITYPAEIATQKLMANDKSGTFELKNPSTIKFFEKDDALSNSNSNPVRMYAANGLPLKKVEGISSSGSANGKSYFEYMYWGKIASVQVDAATKWITKEIPFTLKPAPKLVKKKE